jgi:hypothetical protein
MEEKFSSPKMRAWRRRRFLFRVKIAIFKNAEIFEIIASETENIISRASKLISRRFCH